ncbi:MAG: hypothetical protein V4754_20225 [Pseudomonadota bacterium]
MLHGHFGNSINSTIEQGQLKSIDLANNQVVLHSTTYDHIVIHNSAVPFAHRL